MLTTVHELVIQIKQLIKTSTAIQAKELVIQDKSILIDVREPNEFSKKSAEGAINIPRGLLEMKIMQLYPNAEQMIFVHCATGVRSCFAAEQLHRLGYKNVIAITCGLDEVCEAFK